MKKALPGLNLIFYGLVIAANFLANYLPLNNVTTGQVSDRFPSLFTPAGFTFAIWGLIYVLLGLFVVYQLGIFGSGRDLAYYRNKVGYFFILSCVFNIAWIVSWHYQKFFLSMIAIVLLLISLIIIYLRVNQRQNFSASKNWLFTIPFSVYLGWVMVAVIANTAIYLLSINWNRFGFSEVLWTNGIILIALSIFIIFLLREKDIFVMAVFIWAAIGILYNHLDTYNAQYTSVIITTAFALGSASTMWLHKLLRK